MKILTVVGARPQFIKAAALNRKIRELTDWQEIIVHTGQHFDENMSEVFFQELEIPKPDYNLQINSLSHGAMTGRMLEEIEKVIQKEKPDWVLVYGDTNSTLAGALAAKKLHVPVAHVEAGLRSFDERMPEEVNRVITDRISDLLFAPSKASLENLEKEGVRKDRIKVVGDIMYDAVLHYRDSAREKSLSFELPSKYALLTLHRQENTDDPEKLARLVDVLNDLNQKQKILYPIHPRTKKKLQEFGLELKVQMINPVGYLDMIRLIDQSSMVLTDSGGLQKEAFYLGKFCITLRENTEWTELVELGVNRICGSNSPKIQEAFADFASASFPSSQKAPYGKGDTAEKIISILGSS